MKRSRLFRAFLAFDFALTIGELCLVPASAFADTFHFREAVSYMATGGPANATCLIFQTVQGGGVYGIDNSAGGDSGATGYTGLATRYVIHVAAADAFGPVGGFVDTMIASSRFSNQTLTVNFNDAGLNAATGCPVASDAKVVNLVGQ